MVGAWTIALFVGTSVMCGHDKEHGVAEGKKVNARRLGGTRVDTTSLARAGDAPRAVQAR